MFIGSLMLYIKGMVHTAIVHKSLNCHHDLVGLYTLYHVDFLSKFSLLIQTLIRKLIFSSLFRIIRHQCNVGQKNNVGYRITTSNG